MTITAPTMKCKNIPDRPVLQYLLLHKGQPCNWCWAERNVAEAMPAETPDKLVLAKMRQLIKRGLVEGCGCGCRGDFEITAKGEVFLSADTETIHTHHHSA